MLWQGEGRGYYDELWPWTFIQVRLEWGHMIHSSDLASYIDHTNLKPDATSRDIELLCEEAIKYGFHSVCINPCWVPFSVEALKNSSVRVCTVIGFPLGCNLSSTKITEAQECFNLGSDEFDMVINVGALKEARWGFVFEEVSQVVKAVKGRCVKVILETCLLTKEEIIMACSICERAGAHFIKTSTGLSKEGATIGTVTLIRESVSQSMGIKASGGVRDRDVAAAMIEAGATRIGTSSGILITSTP